MGNLLLIQHLLCAFSKSTFINISLGTTRYPLIPHTFRSISRPVRPPRRLGLENRHMHYHPPLHRDVKPVPRVHCGKAPCSAVPSVV